MTMQVTVLPAAAIAAEQLERWSALQLADATLASPFFRPEFTLAVAAVGRDVRVGILEEEGRAVGFFPFERRTGGIGRPVGGAFSDYHGVIAEPGVAWDAGWLVRACGLRAWEFDHLPAAQQAFSNFITSRDESFYLDLSAGFAAYERARREAGSKVVAKVRRASRLLEQAWGPVSFTAEEVDPAGLRELLRLKSAQYRRTGKVDLFASGSVVELFERLLAERAPLFAGVLSTLRARDRLIAAHFGLRSREVWHYWVPAYDPAFASFQPGLVLLLEMARHAEAMGVGVIDLGRGEEPYKRRLMSGAFPLAQGAVTTSRAIALRRALKQRADAAAARSERAALALRTARSLKLRLEELRRMR